MELWLLRYFLAVADEGHVGRAATRLHISQPPLSRAVRKLEADLGQQLFVRTRAGVMLTAAGRALLEPAQQLLELADALPARIAAAAEAEVFVLGSLVDSAEQQLGAERITAFRAEHPGVRVRVVEVTLADPTAGLRGGQVDAVLTRTPFDDRGIATRVLRTGPVGVVLRESDPLAARERLVTTDLRDRSCVRLPDGADPRFAAYWTVDGVDGPVRHTVQECLQEALWNGTVALAPVGQPLPAGLVCVPLADRPPSAVVLAWRATDTRPLLRAFTELLPERMDG